MKRRILVFLCLACTISVFYYTYKSYYSYLPTSYPIDSTTIITKTFPTRAQSAIWLSDKEVLTTDRSSYEMLVGNEKITLYRQDIHTGMRTEIPITTTSSDIVVLSPNGKKILQWAATHKRLQLFDIRGKHLKTWKVQKDPMYLYWSPASSKIYIEAWGSSDLYVEILDANNLSLPPKKYRDSVARYLWEPRGFGLLPYYFYEPFLDDNTQISAHLPEIVTPGVPHTDPSIPDGIEIQVHDLKTHKTSRSLLKLPITVPYEVLSFKPNNKDQILWLVALQDTSSKPTGAHNELWISDIQGKRVRFEGRYAPVSTFQALDWLPNGKQFSVTELNRILVFNLK